MKKLTNLELLMEYMEQNQYFIGNDLLGKYDELRKKEQAEQLRIAGVGCSVILKEMNKQMDKYYEDHKHCNIVTLDLDDVYRMLEKSEKKAKKKLSKK